MLEALLLMLEWAILLDTRVCLYVFVNVYVCLEIVQKTTLRTLQILLAVYQQLS